MATTSETGSRGTGRAAAVQRAAVHAVFGTRRWVRRDLAAFAAGVHGKRILEIGSGRQDLGEDAYSFQELFAATNEFVQSDVDPRFGHEVVDVTAMHYEEEFDVVLCLYVLEHVYPLEQAVEGVRQALRPGGVAVIAVPHLYPYHDEPIDFWRFTEHSLRRLLDSFTSVEIRCRGPRRFPLALLAYATK